MNVLDIKPGEEITEIQLSIVIPFYNSEKKCLRLLKTLNKLNDAKVELLFVDDGSSDGTMALLRQFEKDSNNKLTVIPQENMGAGGARNTGLKNAVGEYVWFVDSDDDINLEVINVLDAHIDEKYDFIDFNIESGESEINTMNLIPGVYTNDLKFRKKLINQFGRIWSKIIRREFILDNNLLYPEYCIIEDNTMLFLYPFYVKKFLKDNLVSYYHFEDFDSMTRAEPTLRYFDRMLTTQLGLERGGRIANPDEVEILHRKFINLYLFNTIGVFMGLPRSYDIPCRIMRQYRDVAKENNARLNVFKFGPQRLKLKMFFYLLWPVSFLFGNQSSYFENIRLEAWGKKFHA